MYKTKEHGPLSLSRVCALTHPFPVLEISENGLGKVFGLSVKMQRLFVILRISTVLVPCNLKASLIIYDNNTQRP